MMAQDEIDRLETWNDNSGRRCHTPPEQLIQTDYMRRMYAYDSETTKPKRSEWQQTRSQAIREQRELERLDK